MGAIEQGGLSDEVFNSEHCKSYQTNPVIAGYYGSEGRSKSLDAIIENRLREQGLTPNQISMWLSSSRGRHMMDMCASEQSHLWVESWLVGALEYAKNIEKELTSSSSSKSGVNLTFVRLTEAEAKFLKDVLAQQDSWFRPEPWKTQLRHILANIVAE